MKIKSSVAFVAALSVMSCTAQKDVKKTPDSISGIYPRLAYYNNEGECGGGALGRSFMGNNIWAAFTEWLFRQIV